MPPRSRRRRCATATTTCSTAPKRSSPTRGTLACTRSWPPPTGPRGRGALDECVAATTETGKGVSEGAQFALADMTTAIEAARALTWQATRLCDLGRPFTTAAAMAKLVATDTAMQVTSDADRAARDSAGLGSGVHLARLDRFLRDAKATQLYEGTNQIQRLVIARHILQPPA